MDHVAIHSELRPFECDLCPARFKEKNTLRRHQQRRHRMYGWEPKAKKTEVPVTLPLKISPDKSGLKQVRLPATELLKIANAKTVPVEPQEPKRNISPATELKLIRIPPAPQKIFPIPIQVVKPKIVLPKPQLMSPSDELKPVAPLSVKPTTVQKKVPECARIENVSQSLHQSMPDRGRPKKKEPTRKNLNKLLVNFGSRKRSPSPVFTLEDFLMDE